MLSLHFPLPITNILIPLESKSKPGFTKIPVTQTNGFFSRFSQMEQRRNVLAAATDGFAVAQESTEVEELPEGLRPDLMPKHVAVIMDGSARWARHRGLPAAAGYKAAVRSLREMVELCCRWGIGVLTVFAFSTENWIRPKVDIQFFMTLVERAIKSELDCFARRGIRVSVIGDSSKLPKSLHKLISEVEETTKENSRHHLLIAISYSGKYDVVQACRAIAEKAKEGVIQLEDINESLIEQELETNCTKFPSPDLLIRTSGELRVSNFLLWQLAYTELFFVQALWPEFGRDEFVAALTSFQQRRRRFGGRS